MNQGGSSGLIWTQSTPQLRISQKTEHLWIPGAHPTRMPWKKYLCDDCGKQLSAESNECEVLILLINLNIFRYQAEKLVRCHFFRSDHFVGRDHSLCLPTGGSTALCTINYPLPNCCCLSGSISLRVPRGKYTRGTAVYSQMQLAEFISNLVKGGVTDIRSSKENTSFVLDKNNHPLSAQ